MVSQYFVNIDNHVGNIHNFSIGFRGRLTHSFKSLSLLMINCSLVHKYYSVIVSIMDHKRCNRFNMRLELKNNIEEIQAGVSCEGGHKQSHKVGKLSQHGGEGGGCLTSYLLIF